LTLKSWTEGIIKYKKIKNKKKKKKKKKKKIKNKIYKLNYNESIHRTLLHTNPFLEYSIFLTFAFTGILMLGILEKPDGFNSFFFFFFIFFFFFLIHIFNSILYLSLRSPGLFIPK